MKLAMAQMSMSGSMDENLKKSLAFCDAAAGSDLLFFPEVQLTPFFPQYEGRNVDAYVVPADSPTVQAFADKAKAHRLYLSPNMYLEQGGRRYDASLWLTPEGTCAGVAKMVHIMQAAQFYERDYYTPSEDGFLVFDMPWGRVGIVICFDRHLPESIRTCALKGRTSSSSRRRTQKPNPWSSSSGRSACRRCRTRSSSPCATAWGVRTGWTLPASHSSCTRAVT